MCNNSRFFSSSRKDRRRRMLLSPQTVQRCCTQYGHRPDGEVPRQGSSKKSIIMTYNGENDGHYEERESTYTVIL